ncbi:DUF3710 domain-containing protein [Nocardioides sp. GY 10113]|uniref:DUF3710 domain-containing protein n=1 Tax=Nocardioides sp. GY 10113 TaxID=2569761 RepID=UPI001458A810|nr:DUF3710 domain-containing protein [Nocardioides sp. GY 10113]
MRLRRKAGRAEPSVEETDATGAAEVAEVGDGATTDGAGASEPTGPYDIEDVDLEHRSRPLIDLGALLVAPVQGRNLRVQVDEATGAVKAVLLTDESGAVELRAFAAPRNGDLWAEVRPQIAAETHRRGGTATESEGPFGTELHCEVRVALPDGNPGVQHSRVVGVNGPRWMLRATFLGEPARQSEAAAAWNQTIAGIVVRRGAHAMPVGEQLPLTLPEGLQRIDKPAD